MILKTNNEYYIEIDDVLNNSEITEEDLNDTFGEQVENWLKTLSSRTYRVLYSAYKGWNIDQQVLELKYIINNNDDKKAIMMEAIIEYVRGAVYSGMDMNTYLGKQGHSADVEYILRNGGLWFAGPILASEENKAV